MRTPGKRQHHYYVGPFLKWAGGKSQLLKEIVPVIPSHFENYFEPFLGGAALLFHLLDQRSSLKAFISDSNTELINCYLSVQSNVEEVIQALKRHRNDKHYYYKIRSQDTKRLMPAERAARLIYLNKTCFNGLYRVNRSGQFNVPFGKYRNPRIVDEEKLRSVSKILRRGRIDISCLDFEPALKKARAGDFVYLDPPYQPISSTSKFTSYTKSNFDEAAQIRLAAVFQSLDARGVFVLLSNSNSELVRKLYADYQVQEVQAARAINCNGNGRGRIGELLIRNF
ncbi:MAG: modification methylase [Candidatus Melainabacteria bacterium]|nr:MAG: modification methylase [Candidatus Melainabacteria bacterium]